MQTRQQRHSQQERSHMTRTLSAIIMTMRKDTHAPIPEVMAADITAADERAGGGTASLFHAIMIL